MLPNRSPTNKGRSSVQQRNDNLPETLNAPTKDHAGVITMQPNVLQGLRKRTKSQDSKIAYDQSSLDRTGNVADTKREPVLGDQFDLIPTNPSERLTQEEIRGISGHDQRKFESSQLLNDPRNYGLDSIDEIQAEGSSPRTVTSNEGSNLLQHTSSICPRSLSCFFSPPEEGAEDKCTEKLTIADILGDRHKVASAYRDCAGIDMEEDDIEIISNICRERVNSGLPYTEEAFNLILLVIHSARVNEGQHTTTDLREIAFTRLLDWYPTENPERHYANVMNAVRFIMERISTVSSARNIRNSLANRRQYAIGSFVSAFYTTVVCFVGCVSGITCECVGASCLLAPVCSLASMSFIQWLMHPPMLQEEAQYLGDPTHIQNRNDQIQSVSIDRTIDSHNDI